MVSKRLLGILISFSLLFMVSCYSDNTASMLPFLAGATVADDTASGDTTGTGDTGTGSEVTDPEGDEGGDPVVPEKKLSIDDVKNILNTVLADINAGGLLLSLKGSCVPETINLVAKDTITVDAQVSCDPFVVVLTITLKQYLVDGIACALNGVMTIRSQFPTNDLGAYLLTINTAESSPLATQGDDCGDTSIVLSNLSMCVTLNPFSSQFSGTVVINDEVSNLAEFTTPADILAILKDAIDNIPWDELLAWLQSNSQQSSLESTGLSGLAATSAQSSTSYTVYDEDGLKVGVGLSKTGVMLNLTFTAYKIDTASSTALSGTITIDATLDTWTVLKLVCNTEAGAPLTISGIPFITPKIGLADVTLYYDWYNQELVDKGVDAGTITLNGLSFDFDPGWITTIIGMLE